MYLVDLGKRLDFGAVKNTKRQRDHLQILGTGSGRDIARLSADIINDSLLEPRDKEMGSLAHDLWSSMLASVVGGGGGGGLLELTCSRTPDRRSKMTARVPPLTS